MTETPISRTIRRLFAGGGASACAAGTAGAGAGSRAQAGRARVEITGSNIRRSEAETASSVITVNRADIERSGKSTVAELLQTLAVDNQGSVPTSFGNGFAAGASGISLRGLGAASTLVLLNGRRMAPYGLADDGQKQFTDLNVIPTDAVDRIEVLKDGASAIYGSDAIAGVVNIILRRDFQGTHDPRPRGVNSRTGTASAANIAFTEGYRQPRRRPLQRPVQPRVQEIRRDLVPRPLRPRLDRPHRPAQLGLFGPARRWAAPAPSSPAPARPATPSTATCATRPTARLLQPRQPAAPGFTRTFPGAACSNFTNHPQGDPGGGCLIDASRSTTRSSRSRKT